MHIADFADSASSFPVQRGHHHRWHAYNTNGMVWLGMSWYGRACHAMVWYGMAWYGILPSHLSESLLFASLVCMAACSESTWTSTMIR